MRNLANLFEHNSMAFIKRKFNLLVSDHKLEPVCANVIWVLGNEMVMIVVEIVFFLFVHFILL